MLNIQDAEHFPDESDRASYIEGEANSAAVEAVRLRVAPEMHLDFDGSSCVDCGETLPSERICMGRVRCVACQTLKEKRSRFFG